MQHTDVCTILYRSQTDTDILTRRGFDVNMLLFQSSPAYNNLIRGCAAYILALATTTREGYKTPHGFSGANAGIPLNIIATADPPEVMLNPKYLKVSGDDYREVFTNCGSLLLPEPIRIWRYARITFEFYDLDGKRHERTGYYPTVQHEIDHNLGTLIWDKKV